MLNIFLMNSIIFIKKLQHRKRNPQFESNKNFDYKN